MLNLGTVRPGSTIRIPFSSFDKDDGSSITMTNYAAADILIYKDGSTTERASTAGFTATTDFDTKTGKHIAIIDLADNTTADFFAAGSEYLVAIDAVTVDAVTTGGWIARFVIGYQGAILDTTIATLSSQTSFTLTSGPAEDDALNGREVIIHDAASAVQLATGLILDYTGSTKTVTLAAAPTFTIAAKDNISVMGLAPLQPATLGRTVVVDSAGLADANMVKAGPTGSGTAQTAKDIGGAVPAAAAGASGGLLISGSNSGTTTLGALTVSGATTLSGAVSLGSTLGVTGTTTLAALTTTGTVTFNAWTVTNAATLSGAVSLGSTLGITGAITATNASNNLTLGTFTVTTNAIAWNAAWDAEVQSEVDDALVVHRLDELLNADSDIDGAAPPTVGSVFHELMSKTAGSFTFDQTTDSCEALRDRGDAAWVTATGFSTHSAADVWAVATRVLTANTNLNDPTAASIATAVLTTAMTESYSTDGSTATLAQALYFVMQLLSESSISGTTQTIKKLDGSTTAATLTLNDGTTPTSVTRAS